MRLRWGPHASRLAEQVVIADPHYVLSVLNDMPDGVLAGVFRDLILKLDSRPLLTACARCGRTADGVCAYPGSVAPIGFCMRCLEISDRARPSPALRVDGYEAALRHVVTSFRRGHRVHMRRAIKALADAKGGPERLTEDACLSFFYTRRLASPSSFQAGPLPSGGSSTIAFRTGRGDTQIDFMSTSTERPPDRPDWWR